MTDLIYQRAPWLGDGWGQWQQCTPAQYESGEKIHDPATTNRHFHTRFRSIERAPTPITIGKWFPISRAPHDRAVLVTFAPCDIPAERPSRPGLMVAKWDEQFSEWYDVSSGEPCRLHYGEPTHFMLPLAMPA